MQKIIFIKYGELSTKGDNLKYFIKVLNQNIKEKLKEFELIIKADRARTYIIPQNDDFNKILDKLKEVFGLVKIGIAYKVSLDEDEIIDTVCKLIKKEEFKTFKVNTKRANKNFLTTSMDFNRKVANKIFKEITNIKVDVHEPDLLINIEIRQNHALIYFKEIIGLGGYPVGIQKKGLLMLSGGIDSPVAGYLALKRGIDLECIYFESLPHTSIEARNKVISLCEKLTKYKKDINLYIVPFTKIQQEIYKNCNPNYGITIMRRMMYRIAEQFANKNNDIVLINGESIGQVASQTLNSINVVEKVTTIPIIRPVACFDKQEIIDIAKKIDTYDISILPYEDCCTIFIPTHPIINPKEKQVLIEEAKFDFNNLLEEAINNIKHQKIGIKEKNNLL